MHSKIPQMNEWSMFCHMSFVVAIVVVIAYAVRKNSVENTVNYVHLTSVWEKKTLFELAIKAKCFNYSFHV